MKKLIIALCFGFISFGLQAQETRYIEVVAIEEMEVAPDEYVFTFRLREQTKYIEETTAETEEMEVDEPAVEVVEDDIMVEEEVVEAPSKRYNGKKSKPKKRITISVAEQEETVKKFLKQQGVDVDMLLASNNAYSSSYRKDYTISIKNAKSIPQIIKGLDSLGASRVNIIDAKVGNKNKYRDEMAMKALKQAKEKARKMVAAYGETIGGVISITEIPDEAGQTTNKLYDLIIAEIARKNKTDNMMAKLSYQVKVKFAIK
jgi:hypothetical protein